MKLLGMSREEVKKAIERGEVTIAVYGLGKMGLPLAAVFADHGANVIGVDVKEEVVEKVNRGECPIEGEPGLEELVRKSVEEGRLTATTDGVIAAKRSDVAMIIVPTLIDEEKRPKLDAVFDVSEKIAKGMERGYIVITVSTMPPGTTESLVPILEKSGLKLGEFGLAHAPERTKAGTAIRDITGQYPKIVGASDEKTLEAVIGIYETVNKKGVIPVSSIKVAEAVKVFEGVYRYVNIALANELALWCEEMGIDALEAFRAANTQPFCHLHLPGAGVGGHCIPVYPWFLVSLAKREMKLIKAAFRVNDFMPHHVIELLVKGLKKAGREVKNSKVLLLGLTFRGGVKEFRESPAIKIIEELKRMGAEVFAYDPLCTETDAKRFGAKWKEDFKGVDAILIVTDHEEFKRMDLDRISKEVRTKVIIDGRNVLDPRLAREKGFVYFGIGRP